MEVQAHGNYYEDLKTRQITGLDKKSYDALKENGYTSGMDIMKGQLSVSDYSIKTTGSNSVNCGDLLRRRLETDYNLVVGVYEQCGENKVFHTEYTFYIRPEHEQKLWGSMSYDQLKEYDDFIKSIPYGAELATKAERASRKKSISDKDALFTINPKANTQQRRVQCTLKIKQMIKAGIPHTARTIIETVYSPKRKFKCN